MDYKISEDKIEQHVFRFVEKELYNYLINKKLVESWQKEKEELYSGAKSTLSIDPSGRFSENKITNPTNAEVMRLLVLEGKVNRAKWYVTAIEDVLDILDDQGKKLVELKYFKGLLTNQGVANEMNISLREFYRKRNEIIEKVAIRMGFL